MSENTNPAAFYPHDDTTTLRRKLGNSYVRTRIAIDANRRDPHGIVGFRPDEVKA